MEDNYEDVWLLTAFLVQEAYALRSFLEFLRLSDRTNEEKIGHIDNWRNEVGLSLEAPRVQESVLAMQIFRDMGSAQRKAGMTDVLSRLQDYYQTTVH